MAALRHYLGSVLGIATRFGTGFGPGIGLSFGLLFVGACNDAVQDAPGRSASPPATQELADGLLPAFELANEGHFDDARDQVARYLAADEPGTNLYQAEFLLGYSYQKQKLYAQARGHLLRAAELQPDYHATHHFLGFAQYYLGELDEARRAFEVHLRFRPDEGDDHFGIGLCDLDEGRLTQAEQRFDRAIELHTQELSRGRDRRREVAKSRARLGDVYEQRGDLPRARLEYEQAVTTWPAHIEVWHKLHRVLLRQGEDELARLALRQGAEWQAQARATETPPR